jgi:hypothetical protein
MAPTSPACGPRRSVRQGDHFLVNGHKTRIANAVIQMGSSAAGNR